ncbi:MAG: lipoate--protein ligase family protein [Nitrospirota bacterium]
MEFARIIVQEHNSAFFNMALDEAISEAIREKLSPPTLRIYKWEKPSVSIGYFQKIRDINLVHCAERDYPIVRRPTGGRAILHESELTYSFSSRYDSLSFKGRLLEDYSIISKALLSGLKLIGVDAKNSLSRERGNGHKNPACFKAVSFGEVTVRGKKVIGSAQKRYTDGLLQQGSILLDFNAEELRKVLKCADGEDFSDIGSIMESAAEVTFDKLRSSLKEAFETELNIKLITDKPTKTEMKRAKELDMKKYSSQGWNRLR